MGGNAFPGLTQRLDRDRYIDYTTEVLDRLAKEWPHGHFIDIPAYRTKPGFGDLDILVNRDSLPEGWLTRLQELFERPPYIRNGPVASFVYKEFQVDLIVTPYEDFWSSYHYYAWNDLGNLIGKIAHNYGFKLGHRGLYYRYFVNDRFVENILVTRHWDEALRFFGYNAARYEDGFDTLEDIYRYVSSSVYFDPDFYQYDKMSHDDRVRDKKRPVYRGFLEWIEKIHRPTNTAVLRPSADYWLRCLKAYGDFEERYVEAVRRDQERALQRTIIDRVKGIFNGNLVSEWTGLKGPHLGEFLKELKERTPDYYEFLGSDVSQMEIYNWVMTHFKQREATHE